MKTQILKTTGQTLDNYEGIIFSTYAKWCGKYSKNTQELQSHLNNQKIFNWFQNQISTIEKDFLQEIENYKLNDFENFKYYLKSIEKVFKYYPQALGVKPSPFIKISINPKIN